MRRFHLTTGAVYNACEQGLGKTIQTIALCDRHSEYTFNLIVCPAVMLYTWAEEIRKWSPHSFVQVLASSKDVNRCSFEGNFLITTYGLIPSKKNLKLFSKHSYDLLILDEAHYLKNKKAARTKAILGTIWPNCRYKICLSGTPFTQSVLDCYPVFSSILPGKFPRDSAGFYEFAYRYTNATQTLWGPKFDGIRNSEELRSVIKEHFFFRYTKEQVLKELPAKAFYQITLGPEYLLKRTPEEEAKRQEYLRKLRECFAGKRQTPPKPDKYMAEQRREEAVKKLPAVIEYIENLLSQGEPLVVFAYHREVIRTLQTKLKKFNPVTIDGCTSTLARARAVALFQNDETQLFIGQIQAASVGITLTRARTAILAELDWSPAIVAQAVDRLHRIGQRDAVSVYYFNVPGSVESEIEKAVISKSQTFKEALS